MSITERENIHEGLKMIKQVAKYKCDDCGFLIVKAVEKIKHDGMITRHHLHCTICHSENIIELNAEPKCKYYGNCISSIECNECPYNKK